MAKYSTGLAGLLNSPPVDDLDQSFLQQGNHCLVEVLSDCGVGVFVVHIIIN